jgi:hypothetical protein
MQRRPEELEDFKSRINLSENVNDRLRRGR